MTLIEWRPNITGAFDHDDHGSKAPLGVHAIFCQRGCCHKVMKERDDDHEAVKNLVHSVMGQRPEISGLGLRT